MFLLYGVVLCSARTLRWTRGAWRSSWPRSRSWCKSMTRSSTPISVRCCFIRRPTYCADPPFPPTPKSTYIILLHTHTHLKLSLFFIFFGLKVILDYLYFLYIFFYRWKCKLACWSQYEHVIMNTSVCFCFCFCYFFLSFFFSFFYGLSLSKVIAREKTWD